MLHGNITGACCNRVVPAFHLVTGNRKQNFFHCTSALEH